MTVNREPLYTRHAVLGRALVTTAYAAFDGSGTVADLGLLVDNSVSAATGTAPYPNGVRVRTITMHGVGTTAAELLKFFLYDGTTWSVWETRKVSAATPSTSVEAARGVIQPEEPLIVPKGWKLYAGTHGGADFWVYAWGADFEGED